MVRRKRTHGVLRFIVLSMTLAACQAVDATTTPMAAIPTSPPSASMTPRAEAPGAVSEPTGAPGSASPTPFPIPTPALPSADGGPVPPGAIARLGIGTIRVSALSPDGRLLAIGTTAGMYVYDASTFKRLWVQAIEAPVEGVA